MKCIDAHAHLLHDHKGFHEIAESDVFDEIWLMDLNGICLNGLQLATTEEVCAAVKAHPGRVYAFGHLDFSKTPDEVDRLKDLGFIGLKPYKPDTHWNDEKFYPYYARAEELNMPVLFHTGMAVSAGAYASRQGKPYGYGPSGMRPGYLGGISEAFPNLRIIGGHQGYPWFEETVQNIYYYKNIVHDISGYRHFDQLHELLHSMDRAANDGTGRMFHEKLLFATDQFYGMESENQRALKLKEFWSLFFELIASVYCRWGKPEEAEKFFYGNAFSLRNS
ncbi:MAG: amidohydrolase family protein [Lentisphaeria bacterium]|nr:amidohydrolase family protein [Lentisphaeria bacterium]